MSREEENERQTNGMNNNEHKQWLELMCMQMSIKNEHETIDAVCCNVTKPASIEFRYNEHGNGNNQKRPKK